MNYDEEIVTQLIPDDSIYMQSEELKGTWELVGDDYEVENAQDDSV